MAELSSFSRSCLLMQGFPDAGDRALASLNRRLRFTPALCLVVTVAATLTRAWAVLAGLAAVALLGWLRPGGHPFDLLYNRLVAPLLGRDRLPPNPPPRRLALLLAVPVLAGAAVAFALGFPALGYTLAGLQLAGCATYVLSGFCVASWLHSRITGRTARAASATARAR